MSRYALLLIALPLLAGCAQSRYVPLLEEKQDEVDALRAENYELEERLRALGDSLQFYAAIESGSYYRDRRLLTDRITKLEYDLEVCRDGGRPVETLLADELFEPGTATLTDAGRARIAEMARTLLENHRGEQIRVEGHTDSVPLGPNLRQTYPTNWELSAARATAVVRELAEAHALPAGQLEAAAFGATRPVARNDSEAGRRQNRRVEILTLPSRNP